MKRNLEVLFINCHQQWKWVLLSKKQGLECKNQAPVKAIKINKNITYCQNKHIINYHIPKYHFLSLIHYKKVNKTNLLNIINKKTFKALKKNQIKMKKLRLIYLLKQHFLMLINYNQVFNNLNSYKIYNNFRSLK